MKTNEMIRERVARTYGKLVSESKSCGGEPVRKGAVAQWSGYDESTLTTLPEEAVVNSFGCGNPLAFVGVKEGDVVLDLGSGAGLDLLIAAEKVGPNGQVIGIDMSEEMLKKAQDNIKASGLKNVEVRNGIIERLPVRSGTVDWVISNCVINLSPEKERVFAEMMRVLKPGGQFSISDLVVEEKPDWLERVPGLYESCIMGAISENEYLEKLKTAGFVDVEVKERLVYNRSQLKAFCVSEFETLEPGKSSCCCGSNVKLSEVAIHELEGKVASVKIYGRKA